MTNFVLLNSGDFVLLNSGDNVLLNAEGVVVAEEGGGSGGRIKKQVGYQLTDLGPRPHVVDSGESVSQLIIKPLNHSKAKLTIKILNESICNVIPFFGGVSVSKLTVSIKVESRAKLYYKAIAESWGIPHPSVFMEWSMRHPPVERTIPDYSVLMEGINKKTESIGKALKALSGIYLIDSMDEISNNNNTTSSNTLQFGINETNHNEQLIAFTHSSSWIGNVRYDTEAKTMRILMNGKAFNHCGVERIDYDKFEGAPSKGEHWWREIKDRFSC